MSHDRAHGCVGDVDWALEQVDDGGSARVCADRKGEREGLAAGFIDWTGTAGMRSERGRLQNHGIASPFHAGMAAATCRRWQHHHQQRRNERGRWALTSGSRSLEKREREWALGRGRCGEGRSWAAW